MVENPDALAWRRASLCGNTTCVEIAATADGILVRDSEDPDGVRLKFGMAEWRAFIADLRVGTFVPPG